MDCVRFAISNSLTRGLYGPPQNSQQHQNHQQQNSGTIKEPQSLAQSFLSTPFSRKVASVLSIDISSSDSHQAPISSTDSSSSTSTLHTPLVTSSAPSSPISSSLESLNDADNSLSNDRATSTSMSLKTTPPKVLISPLDVAVGTNVWNRYRASHLDDFLGFW